MRRVRRFVWAGVMGVGLALVVTGGAMADSDDEASAAPLASEVIEDSERYPELDIPVKPWAYDVGYIFALTCGLEDEGLMGWGRGASMVGTIPLDLLGLPTAVIAGLFGS